jgi:Ni/Co efflux regulator RcnB
VGAILPSVFLASTYYFTDYRSAGLQPPARGYHWVRYGPDLLLVQRSTGRIVQVIPNAFL